MSLSHIRSSTPQGRRALAAARLRNDVLELLHDALKTRQMSRTDLAKTLGRGKSAISNALKGDGNLRVNTIAEYLDALDLELELRAVPRSARRAQPPTVVDAKESTEFGRNGDVRRTPVAPTSSQELTMGIISTFWHSEPMCEGPVGTQGVLAEGVRAVRRPHRGAAA